MRIRYAQLLLKPIWMIIFTIWLMTACSSTPESAQSGEACTIPTNTLRLVVSDNPQLKKEVSVWVEGATSEAATYTWSIDGKMQAGQTKPLFSFIPEIPDIYTVSVKVCDGNNKEELSAQITTIGPPPASPIATPSPTPSPTPPPPSATPLPTPSPPSATLSPTPSPTPTPSATPTTPSPTPTTPSPTPTYTPTPTPTSTNTSIPTATATPTPYPAPTLTAPDNGVGTQGTFPPLYWQWDGQLAEDEYFEVRVWFEELPYHAALAWVKDPQFDYNVSGERNGKYFWTIVIVKDKKENVRTKDWYKPEQWPYPVYEHKPDIPIDSIQIISLEPEPRFFFFTPDPGHNKDGVSPISNPPSCPSPPC